MKRLATLLPMILFAVLPAVAGAAEARTPSPAPEHAPVLIVDVKRILDESRASVGAQRKIEAQRSAFQSEIAAREQEIRKAEQELLAARGRLKPDAYAEKENQLRKKFREVEQYVQERRRLLEQATALAMGKVRAVLVGIVADVARRRGAQAVLVRQQMLWSEGSLDITNQVLERLNAELPELPLRIGNPPPPPPGGAKDGKKPE